MLKEAEAQNSRELTEILVARGLPDSGSEQIYQTFRLSQLGMDRSQIGRLLDDLMPEVTKSREERIRKPYRDNLRGIVYALGAAGYAFEWVVLPLQDKHYRADARLGKLGLARRRVERILAALEEAKLIVRGRKGYRDPRPNGQSKASQYYPSPQLMGYFAACLYEFEEGFDVELYRYNDFPAGTIPAAVEVADDVQLLRRYNAFMQQFSWARKGPTFRTFSRSMQRGGRLINSYQNIVKHRVPIRPKTLLDGCPIVEPDFSANHLRIAAALAGEELPADPYAEIADETGASRDQIKAFVTRALGATARRQKGGVMKRLREDDRLPVGTELFARIHLAFLSRYAWIVDQQIFFNDTGARMQLHEGNIAIRICEESLRAEKPVLAVHDAFAVRQQDAEWVAEVMREAWKAELKTSIEPVIKVERLA